MALSFQEKLCALLVKNKHLTQHDAKALQEAFKERSQEAFDDFLISEGIVAKADLLKTLSEYYQVPSFDVVGHFFKHNLLLEFPQDVLVRYGIIPLERDGDLLIIVSSQPDNEELLPELAEYVSDEIQFYVGITGDIIEEVMEYYKDSPFDIDEDDDDLEDDEDEDDDDLYDDDDEDELFDQVYSDQ